MELGVSPFTTLLTSNVFGCPPRSPEAQSVPRRGRDFAFLAFQGFGGRLCGRNLHGFCHDMVMEFIQKTYIIQKKCGKSMENHRES